VKIVNSLKIFGTIEKVFYGRLVWCWDKNENLSKEPSFKMYQDPKICFSQTFRTTQSGPMPITLAQVELTNDRFCRWKNSWNSCRNLVSVCCHHSSV